MPFNSGYRARRANDTQGIVGPQSQFLQKTFPKPYITGYSLTGSDDTALDPAGGQTILVNGGNFASGVSAVVDGTQIGSVTLINSNQISFTTPAKASGSYTLIVYNPSSDSAAILVPGLIYSGVPTFTTPAGSIGTVYETKAINTSVTATSDSALTYAVTSGSIPIGSTFYANGVMTGTAPIDSGSTTYTFAVTATDQELQDTTRTFTLTVNTDVVTWSTPASGSTITLDTSAYSTTLLATSAAGYNVSYTANALPAGLTLTGNTISGTATTEGSSSTLLTATAATSNRSATNTISWVVTFGDAFLSYVTALLSTGTPSVYPFNDDASTNNFVVTPSGDTRPNNFNPYTPGYYSVFFDAKTDYISVPATTALTTFTGNFTFEAWIYPTDTSITYWKIWDSRQNGATAQAMVLGMVPLASPVAGQGRLEYFNGTAYLGTGIVYYNRWTHIAFVRSVTTMTFYIDGIAGGTATVSGTQTGTATTNPIWIGTKDNGLASYGSTGYISNLRVVNGTAVYTNNFTPSTEPLPPVANTVLLTCQSNGFVDNSPNSNILTPSSVSISGFDPFATIYQAGTQYYSTKFDGTGDGLSIPASANLAPGTGDFTYECWVYPTSSAVSYRTIFGIDNYGGGTPFRLYQYGTNFQYWYTGTAGNFINSPTITINTWYHLAVIRSSGVIKFFVNGVQTGSDVTSTLNYPSSIFRIGLDSASTYPFVGSISDVRAVNGTAVYTANFIPPTSPLTAISGTSLLTCQDSTIKDNSTNNFTVTVVGDAKPSTAHPYIFDPTYYSTYFDGTDDFLSFTGSPGTTLTANFTIESWVYLNSVSVAQPVLCIGDSFSNPGILFYFANDAKLSLAYTNARQLTGTGTVTANSWNHIAFVRSGSTITAYLNGVSQGTVTNSATFSGTTTVIGREIYNSSVGAQFNGYISNLRVVKGTAVYTANFTPPTQPLTAITNTSLLTCRDSLIIDRSANVFAITANGNAAPAAVAPFTQPSSYTNTQITTYGSTYFDGTGDWLTVPYSSAFSLGTTYTIEAWVYPTALNAANHEIFNILNPTVTNFGGCIFYVNASGVLYFETRPGNGGVNIALNGGTVLLNTWTHVCISVNAGAAKLFVNGTQVDSDTVAALNGTQSHVAIGAFTNGFTAYPWTGYISNLRVVKGTAVYAANFTPPTNLLTAITGTSLLTLQSNQPVNNNVFLDSSSNNLLVTRAGNATQGTFSPYGENWSNYFDGTGDYLTAPSGSGSLGTGNFTVEGWIYCTNSVIAYPTIFSNYSAAGSTAFAIFNSFNNSKITMYVGGSTLAASTNITLNTWIHIAAVRNSGVVTLYINGVSQGTVSYSGSSSGDGIARVAAAGDNPTGTNFTGYVSNTRWVIGTAVYTSNFTPSTTPLQPIAGTSLLTCRDPNFVDDSPNNFTITRTGDVSVQKFGPFAGTTLPTPYYSAYFNYSDFITAADNASIQLGTGDFTIEFWTYRNSSPTYYGLFNKGNEYGLDNDASRFVYRIGGSVGFVINGDVDLNAWTHIALVKNGATTTLYKNGVSLGTSSSVISNSTSALNIGYCSTGNNAKFPGYITNFRVVKGTAVYTVNFTPPTTPLTAISGTGLLVCQSNQFVDSSPNNIAITVSGAGAKNTTYTPFAVTYSTKQSYTPAVFGGSMYFDGTGDYLSVAASTTYGTLPANGLFTVEGWFYFTDLSVSQQVIFTQRSSTNAYVPYLIWTSTTTIALYVSSDNGSWNIVNNATIATGLTAGQWYHFAYTRNGNTFRFFVNGVQTYTFTSTVAFANTGTFNLGMSPGETNTALKGYSSDVRFINGTSLYNANFVPQNQPLTPVRNSVLLLSGTGAGIYDSSEMSNYETIADAKLSHFGPYNGSYYSNYFDGTGDYLTVPSNTAFAFGTGDFTIEMWVYPQNTSGTGLVEHRSAPSNVYLWYLTSTNLYPEFFTGVSYTGNISVPVNQWSHLAVSRASGTLRQFVNGVLAYSGSGMNTALDSTGNLHLMASNDAAQYSGYTSNLRIVKGTAVYTANFAPPTQPLTAITNTSLLTCQSNKFVDNSTNNFTITRAGDARVATQNPFQINSGQSIIFDGTGDYLAATSSTNYSFGTGNFTVECWVYYNIKTNSGIFQIGSAIFPLTNGLGAGLDASTNWLLYYSNGSQTASGSGPLTGVWHNVAVVRNSGTTRMYVDGTQVISVADAANYTGTFLGVAGIYSTSYLMNGYISDLRITKGVARYTANFTPPTSPFNTK